MLFRLSKEAPSVSTEKSQSCLSKKITLLGTRTLSEYRAGRIPQIINVLPNKIPVYNGPISEVYMICQSGMRSKDAAKILTRKNYHVISIRGGIPQWSSQIERGK